jgi:ABC-type transporter Mla MlaB component
MALPTINIQEAENGNLVALGICDFNSVSELNKLGCALISKYNTPVFDLHELVIADISGLALLLAWSRSAYKDNKALAFINVPEQLKEMIKLVGLATILKIS